jgi:protein involved in polysaccharide export with SLBB domain
LKKEDIVSIASAIEMHEIRKVTIYGEVKTPGEYSYHENMTVQDLIFAAGGTKDNAELRNIEVYRLEKNPDVLKAKTRIAERYTLTIDKNLDGLDFKLEPHDNIIIRSISGYTDIKKVMVEGEVLFPGNYIMTSNSERISDMIKKAGGLNVDAYPSGAFMIRKIATSIAEEKKDQEVVGSISDELVNIKEYAKNEAIIGIKLNNILANPGSKWDLYLEDGDIISIPKELQTVQVLGQVLLPSLVRYDQHRPFKYYIDRSGGFSPNALKRKSFVVYANGETHATKKVLFFNNYPTVEPGAKIYVPEKPKREGHRMSINETIALTSSLVTITALIINLFTKK